jgi:hypothetical protein
MICSLLNRLFLTTPPLALVGHRKCKSHISAGLVFGGQVKHSQNLWRMLADVRRRWRNH